MSAKRVGKKRESFFFPIVMREMKLPVVVACLLLLLTTVAYGGMGIIVKTPIVAPAPGAGSFTSGVVPLNNSGLPFVATSYVVRLTNQSQFNEAFSIPAWERPDLAAPHPALLVADDFFIPPSIQMAKTVIIDGLLLISMGRTAENLRHPICANFYIFLGSSALNGSFNISKAIYKSQCIVPNGGDWNNPETDGGYTVDAGSGMLYHIGEYRFVLRNLTLRGNANYWIVASIAQERMYNTTDYSQNQPRWLLSVPLTAPGSVSIAENVTYADRTFGQQYRVIDRYGTMYRTIPALHAWANATVAEPHILAFVRATPSPALSSKQLAMTIYATDCINITRVPAALVMNSLPPRRDFSTVVAETPVLVPTDEPTVTPSFSLVSGAITYSSSNSPVSSVSTWKLSPSPVYQQVQAPTSVLINYQPPIDVPISSSSHPSPPVEDAVPVSNITNAPVSIFTETVRTILIVGISGVIFVALVIGIMILFATKYIKRMNSNKKYADIRDETALRSLDGDDAKNIPLDDLAPVREFDSFSNDEKQEKGITLPRVPSSSAPQIRKYVDKPPDDLSDELVSYTADGKKQ